MSPNGAAKFTERSHCSSVCASSASSILAFGVPCPVRADSLHKTPTHPNFAMNWVPAMSFVQRILPKNKDLGQQKTCMHCIRSAPAHDSEPPNQALKRH